MDFFWRTTFLDGTHRISGDFLLSFDTQVVIAIDMRPGFFPMTIFSKRSRETTTELLYGIPENTRSQLIHTLQHSIESPGGFQVGGIGRFDDLLQEVGQRLLREYGGLRASGYRAARRSDHPVIEHFFCCEDEEVLDFIEICFQSFQNSPRQGGVEIVNAVFREDGIGYELSPWVETAIDDAESPDVPQFGGKRIQITYPTFVRLENRLVHREIIKPSLHLLASEHFTIANQEMLKAHGALRLGDYAAAITACGAAFESTMKTICDRKNWHYDKDRDTCASLIEVCRKHGLFPEFYTEALKFTGTIRNRLGDAHGRGPKPDHDATSAHAEHMLNSTSSQILLLVRLSGLE